MVGHQQTVRQIYSFNYMYGSSLVRISSGLDDTLTHHSHLVSTF